MAQSLSIKNDMLSTRVFLTADLCFFSFPPRLSGLISKDTVTTTPSFFMRFFIMTQQSHEGIYILSFFLYIKTIVYTDDRATRKRQNTFVTLAYPMRKFLCQDQKKYATAKVKDAARRSNQPASPWRN